MTTARVTILLPNYRTLLLTKICLRLIRKLTDPALCKVIVIDNDSKDESLDYLRSLSWIQLIERQAILGESVPLSHSRALDQGLAMVTTPYVLSLHTDSFVKQASWLPYLLSHIDNDKQCAGVGSWKLEKKSWLKKLLKSIEFLGQRTWHRWRNRTDHALEGVGANHFYLRSHCALYRTDILKQHDLTFSLSDEVAGKAMHRRLVELGYSMKFLSTDELLPYIDHINHATMILNPELGARTKTVSQGLRKISKQLKQVDVQTILAADQLDS
jgi:GT2 family glycosyltransferase